MVNKITIAIAVMFVLINLAILLLKEDHISKISTEDLKANPSSYVPPIINNVNNENNKISNLYCQNILVKACKDSLCIRLKGNIAFQKPRNFRFTLQSIFGVELDVGSNDKEFWYWSKRDKEKGIHYSSYENLSKTRLKISFNPMIIMKSLGLGEISIANNMSFEENEKYYIINETKKNESSNEDVTNVTVLEKLINKVVAYYVKDINGNLMASSEIEYKDELPHVIKLNSCQENSSLIIFLDNCQINTSLEDTLWQMPNFTPRINIGQ